MSRYQHDYQIGDAVLVDMGTAQVPGVIIDTQEDAVTVRLSEPWSDETGQASDTVSVDTSKLTTYIQQETGGQQALPK